MTTFDIAVIAVILFSGLFAYFRGFVREALSIAAWINAGVIAAYTVPYVSPLFEKFLPKGILADSAAAAVVFILSLMVLHMIASSVARRVRGSVLSPIDRGFGLLFGLARGVIFVLIAYVTLSWVMPQGKDRPAWLADSRSLPYLENGATRLLSYLPLPKPGTRRVTNQGSPSGGNSPQGNSPLTDAARDAENAINAFTHPGGGNLGNAPNSKPPPAYTPDEQRDLNRLIQQQNGR
jgi:membrane protein required for colicin V production